MSSSKTVSAITEKKRCIPESYGRLRRQSIGNVMKSAKDLGRRRSHVNKREKGDRLMSKS